eukprot:TRINITY_DN14878_c0_g1_i1.p1 TRINITY_DN14878_c0_g1~~TRINITY_DN14878_c0_g1_i1.p1  ORF type:complete len:474 (+),score=22.14 TRINITY_DN14878_c0_g1_i1:121-1542(+)
MENETHVKLLVPEREEEEESLGRKILTESKKLWIVSGPAIFTRFTSFGITVITQAFIGHVGQTELAAYALVSTVLLRFANGILLGMASALETLCGQAFGSRQYSMLGIYLQRSWIVLLICTVILLPIFIFATPLLQLVGQEEDISIMAGTISLWFIPINFSYVFTFTLQMFLQAQSKNIVVAYTAAVAFGLHVLFSWLTTQWGWGVAGLMGSMNLALWVSIFGQLFYVFYGGCRDTWTGFSTAAFKDLWPVIKLSTSSGVMLCLELWYNSVLVLLTGNMKNAEIALDALSICLNINAWELMIALGFLAAASVRVSNELGRGSAKTAKFSIMVVVTTSVVIGFIFFVLFLLFSGKLGYLFTDSEEVAKAVSNLSVLLAFSILLNSVQPVLSGVAVGSGWQGVVAYVNLTCYYLVGVPLGVVLGYVINYQVTGLWIGMMIGQLAQTLVLLYVTYRTDWDAQVIKARERVNKWTLK